MKTRTSLLLIAVPLMLAVLGRAQQRFLVESSSTTSSANALLQDLVNDAARTALTKLSTWSCVSQSSPVVLRLSPFGAAFTSLTILFLRS